MTRNSTSIEDQYLRIAHRITERDRSIVRLIGKFRVLTTEHLARLVFDSVDRAQDRLTSLHRLGLLERFRPRPRAPYHYVMGELGAFLLAARKGPGGAGLAWRSDHVLAIAHSQRLAHLVGVNGIAVSLLAHARRTPGVSVRWWPETACSPWCGRIVRPDARLVYEEDGVGVEAFLEYDRGTEPLARLSAQVERYARLEAERGIAPWVLYALPTARRERHARRVLSRTDVAVATTALKGAAKAHEAVWLPLGHAPARLRLVELGHAPKPTGAMAREAAGGRHTWRYAGHDPHPDF